MKVYHGSYMEIPKPDILHSRNNVDFGKGFYITPLLEQAEKWCRKFKGMKKEAVVSVYKLDDEAFEKCKVKIFETYSEEWLDFVLNCRSGSDNSVFDLVMGGVANDKVFNTVELYFDGLIDKAEAIKRLRYEKPNQQIVIRTEQILTDYLHFEGSKKL